jgi:molecular chaperone GrpE
MQSGYVIADRVLRAAMVGVAKGGPKAEPKPIDPAPPKDETAA